MFAQQVLNGIVLGSVYALFSMGFTIIFGIHRILNLAHGGIFMAGALIGCLTVNQLGYSLFLAFTIATIGAGVLSVALYYVVFRPLRKRTTDEFAGMIVSIGANLVLINIAQQITGAQILSYPFDIIPVQSYRLFGIRISLQQIAIISSSAAISALLYFYFYRTSLGIQIRAVALSERTATMLGVNSQLVFCQTFFVAGVIAGAAGVILGVAFNGVSYQMGESIMLRAFAVVIVGGLGSIGGCIVAGLFLGVVQTITAAYLSSQLADVMLFAILIAVLLLQPNGLFPGLHAVHRRV